MNNKSKKTVYIVALAVILDITLIAGYMFMFGYIKNETKDSARLSAELREYLDKEGKANLVKKAVKETHTERQRLNTYFVTLDNMPEFTQKLESLAGLSGASSVQIKTITPRENNVLFTTLSFEGGFGNIVKLVRLVENLPFNIEIKRVHVFKIKKPGEDGEEGWSGNLEFNIIGFLDEGEDEKK